MFIYLVATVVIVCSIFGLTYSQTLLRAIGDGGAHLSTIQLPAFSHSTPLINRPRAGVDGDNGITERLSQQSLEISSEGMEEVNGAEETDEDRLKDDRYQLERRIFDQKLRDANQLGIAESLWSPAPQRSSDKVMKDIINQKYASEGSKPAPQKLNTNTIFNMIQYETFKEAMAVLQKQQEEEEKAVRIAAENGLNEKTFPDEERKENIPVRKNAN